MKGGGGAAAFLLIGAIFALFYFHVIHFDVGNMIKGTAAAVNTPPGQYGQALVKVAESHQGEAYVWGGGHPPDAYQKGNGVDCSGLVDVAVYDVTHGRVDDNQVAGSFDSDPHWKVIPFSEAKAGDIVYRQSGDPFHDHVAFVVSNGGDGNLTIFQAWTSHAPLSQQVNYAYKVSYSSFTGAARFTG